MSEDCGRKTRRVRGLLMRAVVLVLAGWSLLGAQTGARYLIITNDTFFDAIQPLADWKHRKGLMCRVVRTSEAGQTPAALRSFIREAYATWSPRPEYVLLVGSGFHLPAASRAVESDNGYGDMLGDYRMELPVGRFPCKTPRQCSTMVARTLAYERTPDVGNDRWFRHATTVVREDYDPDDTVYWADARYAIAGARAAGFTEFDSLSAARGDDAFDIEAAVDQGTAFVLFRGAGVGNWPSPFAVHPERLANSGRFPVVASVICMTITLSQFRYDSTVANAWLVAGTPEEPRGCVAFFGNTVAQHNVTRIRSSIARGFFTGWFPESLPTLGQAMLRAKRQVYDDYRDSTNYFGFNLLGDPELNLWTRRPERLDLMVTSDTLGDSVHLTVTAECGDRPVPGALVCIAGPGLHRFGHTDGAGQCRLAYLLGTAFRLTVTARNCLPWEGFFGPDVGTVAIVAPLGRFDSGQVVTPSALVRNTGSEPATFAVRFAIPDLGYADRETLTLTPGNSATPTFAPVMLGLRPTLLVQCSTELPGDLNPANDKASGHVSFGRDVGVDSIIVPNGEVETSATVVPQVRVRNFGPVAAAFLTRFWIPELNYSDTQPAVVAADSWALVLFRPVLLPTRRMLLVSCSTQLGGDVNPGNDRATVRVLMSLDAGVFEIITPTGTYDSGAVVTPRARVRNFGYRPVTLGVRFTIPDLAYADRQDVSLAGYAYSDTLCFAPVALGCRPTLPVQCSTALRGDILPQNDLRQTTLRLRGRDVGVLQVIAPTSGGVYATGDTVTPRVVVRSQASVRFGARVQLTIHHDYDVELLADLDGTVTETLDFPVWPARDSGAQTVVCRAIASCDTNPANDLRRFDVMVGRHDFAPAGVVWPQGPAVPAARCNPVVAVANPGYHRDSGWVVLMVFSDSGLGPGYCDSVALALGAGQRREIVLSAWRCPLPGRYWCRVVTRLTSDMVRQNDTLVAHFTVVPGRRDAAIGALIAPQRVVGLHQSFQPACEVGNFGTLEADLKVVCTMGWGYRDSWAVPGLAPGHLSRVAFRPFIPSEPGPGYALFTVSTPGDDSSANDTRWTDFEVAEEGFPRADWEQLADIPAGPVSEGAALAAGSGLVYALKGSGTTEFYEYDRSLNTWTTRAELPTRPVRQAALASAGGRAGVLGV